MAAATSSSAPKLALVHGRSPLALVDKVESLNTELGPATRSDPDGQPEPEVPEIPGIPVKLSCVGAGTTGVVFELFPQLQKKFTAEELDTIAENAMSCIGDHWMMPECGSALWVLYKRVCDKDLDKLAETLLPENVADSREQIKRHM